MAKVSAGWTSYAPLPQEVPVSTGDEPRPELADVGRLARRAVRGLIGAARAAEGATLSRLLREHLLDDSAESAVVEELWPQYEHVNVQTGLDAWLAQPAVTHQVVGVVGFQHGEFGLAEMIGGGVDAYGLRPGNLARVNLACGPDGRVRPCVRCGLYLISVNEQRAALLLRGGERHSLVTVQVMSSDDEFAQRIAAEVRVLLGGADTAGYPPGPAPA
jgi:hypothetical protein